MTFTAHTSIGVGVATRKILIVQSGLFQPTPLMEIKLSYMQSIIRFLITCLSRLLTMQKSV